MVATICPVDIRECVVVAACWPGFGGAFSDGLATAINEREISGEGDGVSPRVYACENTAFGGCLNTEISAA